MVFSRASLSFFICKNGSERQLHSPKEKKTQIHSRKSNILQVGCQDPLEADWYQWPSGNLMRFLSLLYFPSSDCISQCRIGKQGKLKQTGIFECKWDAPLAQQQNIWRKLQLRAWFEIKPNFYQLAANYGFNPGLGGFVIGYVQWGAALKKLFWGD